MYSFPSGFRGFHNMHDFLRHLHARIQLDEATSVTQGEMAQRLKISRRTYVEYLRGTNKPVAMRVLLDMLSQLDDQALIEVLARWRQRDQPPVTK